MNLEKVGTVDAIGLDNTSNAIMMILTDAWDWSDVQSHHIELQNKLNSYFEFVETGQIYEAYPDAIGKKICINIIHKHPIPSQGLMLIEKATELARQLNVGILQQSKA